MNTSLTDSRNTSILCRLIRHILQQKPYISYVIFINHFCMYRHFSGIKPMYRYQHNIEYMYATTQKRTSIYTHLTCDKLMYRSTILNSQLCCTSKIHTYQMMTYIVINTHQIPYIINLLSITAPHLNF